MASLTRPKRNCTRTIARTPRARFAVVLVAAFGLLLFTMPIPPTINDISTDLQNPPQFSNAKLNPLPESFKSLISGYYTDLKPLKVAKSKEEVFSACISAAGKMPRWKLSKQDSDSGIIEGVASTALLRFKDDFVIRLTEAEAGSTTVDMRSKSRLGKGDLGANAKRIQEFFAKVMEEMS